MPTEPDFHICRAVACRKFNCLYLDHMTLKAFALVVSTLQGEEHICLVREKAVHFEDKKVD